MPTVRATLRGLMLIGLFVRVSAADGDLFEAPAASDPGALAARAAPVSLECQSWTLPRLEQVALANNPTLVQARAYYLAEVATAYQAGRYKNPVVGYVGEQIGIEGSAGEFQGAYVSQEVITGGKRKISRQKYEQRARIAETYVYAQQLRIVNDVRLYFVRTLAAQQMLSLRCQLLDNALDGQQTAREMFNLGQANQAHMLEAEVEVDRARLEVATAEQQLARLWRQLASVLGTPDMHPQPLVGSLALPGPPLTWDEVRNQLLSGSPELLAARQKVVHDHIAVRREIVQPIPNMFLEANAGYSYETDDAVAGFGVGFNLPILNRNRGTIGQAKADLMQSEAEVRRMELELTEKLAEHFRHYQQATVHVATYRDSMLPKSQQAYNVLSKAYQERRAVWPDVLDAQRRWLELQIQSVHSQLALQETDVLLRGMLLKDGLHRPPRPMDGGHMDATPQPR